MEEQFIPLEKITTVEEAINWLSDYETDNLVKHNVARNKFEKDVENTKLLIEIGQLNAKRKILIAKLLENSEKEKLRIANKTINKQ